MDQKLLIVDDQSDMRKMLRLGMGYGKYQMGLRDLVWVN